MDNDDDANDESESPKNEFWNLSNDEYYNPRLVDSVGKNLGSINLQVRNIENLLDSLNHFYSISMQHQLLSFVHNYFPLI